MMMIQHFPFHHTYCYFNFISFYYTCYVRDVRMVMPFWSASSCSSPGGAEAKNSTNFAVLPVGVHVSVVLPCVRLCVVVLCCVVGLYLFDFDRKQAFWPTVQHLLWIERWHHYLQYLALPNWWIQPTRISFRASHKHILLHLLQTILCENELFFFVLLVLGSFSLFVFSFSFLFFFLCILYVLCFLT